MVASQISGQPDAGPAERTEQSLVRVNVDVLWTLGSNVVGALLGVIAGMVLARWLGPVERGRYELGLFVANSGVIALGLGLTIPTAVFTGRNLRHGLWAYRLGLKLALAYAVIGVSVALFGPMSFPGVSSPGFELAVTVSFVGLLAFQLMAAGLIGLGRIRNQNIAVAARWIALFVIVVSLSLTGNPQAHVGLAAFACSILVGVIVAIAGWGGTVRSGAWVSRNTIPRAKVLWFGVRGQVGNLLQFASYRFDVLLVSVWVGSGGVGVYAVGVMFAEVVWLLPKAVATVLLSYTSRSSVQTADARIVTVFPVTMIVVLAGGVLTCAAAPLVVDLYLGTGYKQVPGVVWLLVPGAVAVSGTKVLASELTARGFPGLNTIIAGITSAVVLSADVLLIPRYGVLGAAVASTIGYTASFLVMYYAFRLKTSVRLLSEIRRVVERMIA